MGVITPAGKQRFSGAQDFPFFNFFKLYRIKLQLVCYIFLNNALKISELSKVNILFSIQTESTSMDQLQLEIVQNS